MAASSMSARTTTDLAPQFVCPFAPLMDPASGTVSTVNPRDSIRAITAAPSPSGVAGEQSWSGNVRYRLAGGLSDLENVLDLESVQCLAALLRLSRLRRLFLSQGGHLALLVPSA